jgi:mannose-1-phosphate guanylyltransferase / phosphomannomutase
MRAVVMAGGEGTRLRPLTSNQPKPMVPICGKPCIEHIVELVHRHGIEDVVVTLAFMPQVIRSYLGDGSALGVRIEYAVEEQPLGTAGSVRNAKEHLDETFIVISGDALCDFDLGEIIAFHRERGALATLALKSVDNPLEFGVVIVDEQGRIERFLEKPSWGQVFSDTINTGVYVIEPELLDRIPEGEPYDFSKQLFPELLAEGAPLYGYVVPEQRYWKDIGTIEQFREANQDVLDGLVGVDVPGVRLKENIWLGEGVTLPSVDVIEGPSFLGAYTTVEDGAKIGPYAVLGANVTVKAGASVQRSVIDGGTHVGTNATVRGSTVGRNCDLRARVRVDEGAALGDECVVGEEALIGPEVRVYPYKTIEAGAQIRQNLVWESRGVRSLFSRDGVVGTINVDVTPEVAVRLGMAFGTQLERGATVVVARDGHPAARMITRALVSGLVSTGVHVADLRIAWPALVRHYVRLERLAGGIYVRVGQPAPESVEITFLASSGLLAGADERRGIERAYARQEYRRASVQALGRPSWPPDALERYADALVTAVDAESVRSRAFRMVVDYGGSPASQAVPRVMGSLGVEVIGLNAYSDRTNPRTNGSGARPVAGLVVAAGADLGVELDPSAEQVRLIDEHGEPISGSQLLLLLVSLAARRGLEGDVAVPVTATSRVEELAAGSRLRVRRAPANAASLTAIAAAEGVLLAADDDGRVARGGTLPADDALAAVALLLELWVPEDRPLSALVAELPEVNLVHEDVHCPWAAKGLVMRTLIDEAKGYETDNLDGLKVYLDEGWVSLMPDPDHPRFHIFAEGRTPAASEALCERYRARLLDLVVTQEAAIEVEEAVLAKPSTSA